MSGLKGVVLAAGLGTRLRPLTERYPKPLIPFCGTTPLALALWRLQSVSVGEVAVNAHHLPQQIIAALAANPFRQRLELSFEPEILGTGGAYNPLRDWQGAADLLVINGDVVTDIDVEGLIACHRAAGAVATMALLPSVIPGENAVFHRDGRIVAIGKQGPAGAAAGNFACVQLLSRAFVDLLPRTGSFDVIKCGYQVALEKGLPVAAFSHTGRYWADLGSPARYWQGVRDYLALDESTEAVGVTRVRAMQRSGTVLRDSRAAVAATANVGPEVVIEAGAVVEDGATVRHAVLLPGARVAAGELVERVIVGGNGLRIELPG